MRRTPGQPARGLGARGSGARQGRGGGHRGRAGREGPGGRGGRGAEGAGDRGADGQGAGGGGVCPRRPSSRQMFPSCGRKVAALPAHASGAHDLLQGITFSANVVSVAGSCQAPGREGRARGARGQAAPECLRAAPRGRAQRRMKTLSVGIDSTGFSSREVKVRESMRRAPERAFHRGTLAWHGARIAQLPAPPRLCFLGIRSRGRPASGGGREGGRPRSPRLCTPEARLSQPVSPKVFATSDALQGSPKARLLQTQLSKHDLSCLIAVLL
ncbi:transcription factor SOX-4-like [Penaeus indicus]|uniref:transcription factor SOX-4-like n=1 Tax=Penaeus indicus TaxID=29960 RepID=UPI00300CC7D6